MINMFCYLEFIILYVVGICWVSSGFGECQEADGREGGRIERPESRKEQY